MFQWLASFWIVSVLFWSWTRREEIFQTIAWKLISFERGRLNRWQILLYDFLHFPMSKYTSIVAEGKNAHFLGANSKNKIKLIKFILLYYTSQEVLKEKVSKDKKTCWWILKSGKWHWLEAVNGRLVMQLLGLTNCK